MFTGLVQAMGKVASRADSGQGAMVIGVDTAGWGVVPSQGDSIAVAGVCLTVVQVRGSALQFDVMQQTISLTRLGDLVVGDMVNLEAALRADSLLGGHLVAGHVEGTVAVTSITDDASGRRLRVQGEARLLECCYPQGSVALDGVSLTIANTGRTADKGWIEVALIPTTLERTTLGTAAVGTRLNFEGDQMAKMVHATVVRELAQKRRTL